MNSRMKKITNLIKINDSRTSFLLLFVASLILTFLFMYLLHPGDTFKIGYDTFFHIKRFETINVAINNGTYPFYIDTTLLNGYGYATNLFYPDMMLVPFALLINYIGVLPAYKLMLCFYFILCAIISYYCILQVFKKTTIAFLFAILYSFSFYRIHIIGQGGGMAIFIALCFFPIVLWGIYEILWGDFKRKWYIISIGFCCMIFSHLLTSLMAFMSLGIFLLLAYKQIKKEPTRILYLIYAGILSLLISSFYLFPMLEQLLDNTFYYKTQPFVDKIASRTFRPHWIMWGIWDGLSYKIMEKGGIGIILTLPLFCRIFIQSNKSKLIKCADIFTIIGFIILFSISFQFLWDVLSNTFMNIFRYTFRFLFFPTFLFACSGSIYIYEMSKKLDVKRIYLIYATLITLNVMFIYNMSNYMHDFGSMTITTQNIKSTSEEAYIVGGEYIPARVKSFDYFFERGKSTVEIFNSSTEISNVDRSNAHLTLDVKVNTKDDAILPLTYYKGYRATLNGKDTEIKQSEDGLVQIGINESGSIDVWYAGTIIYKLSFFVTIISIVGLCIYLFYQNKKKSQMVKTLVEQ